jgi:nucleotide-binding universal stress UspA family protein
MFKHILIPTDLTDRAELAIKMTKTLISGRPTRVTILHVIQTVNTATFDELRDFYLELEKRSASRLDTLRHQLTDAGIDTEQAVLYGKPALEITRFAQTHDVDLIALASHPLDPSGPPQDWGTLSYKIGMLSTCPVLLVK